MKKIITLSFIVMLSLNLMAAETLSFKFSNPRIIFNAGTNYLVFDVLVKATANGSYLYSSQVSCNVNITNFNTTTNPSFIKGFIAGKYSVFPDPEADKYNIVTNWNSDLLNIAILANPTFNGNTPSSGAYSAVTTNWQSLGTVYAKIATLSGAAGVSFSEYSMNSQQTFATGIGPSYSGAYISPNIYEGFDFTDLYLNRIFSGGSGWTQAGGVVDWAASVNTSVWDTIATAAVAGANAMAADLKIHPGGRLLVNPAGNLTVTGTLTNDAGNNGLVLKSDATGTGSLIENTANVPATVERYIDAVSDWLNAPSDGWHLISSPVASQSISGSWTPSDAGNNYDFYAFNETNLTPYEYWLNQKVPGNTIISFIPGKGYLTAYEQTGTKEFTGVLNSASLSPTLSYTPGSPYQGFNLVGNPFASAIGWTTGSWTKTNIDAEAQVWLESTGSYKLASDPIYVNNIIPSMSGFFVHANAANPVLTIPADARTNNTTGWYKTSEEDLLYLVANDLESGTSQSSIVRFNPEATVGYDTKFDSYFLPGFAPQFYSVADNEAYALNTLPEIKDFLEIPFTFIKNSSGLFSIELAKNLPDAVVYLIDKKTDVMQNLSENPVYHFTAADGDQTDRFILHFGSGFLGLNPANTSANFTVWYNKGDIHFSSLPENVLSMSLIDMAGREIAGLGRPAADRVQLEKNLAQGYYIVKVKTTDGVVARKLYIN
jgi:hypothetical protein